MGRFGGTHELEKIEKQVQLVVQKRRRFDESTYRNKRLIYWFNGRKGPSSAFLNRKLNLTQQPHVMFHLQCSDHPSRWE